MNDIPINLRINGAAVAARVAPDLTLADFLRGDQALKGTHVGCEEGVCGSCTVLVNGETLRSCLTLAAQMDGGDVTTSRVSMIRRAPGSARRSPRILRRSAVSVRRA